MVYLSSMGDGRLPAPQAPAYPPASDLRFYAELGRRKARDESGLFLAEGRKLVEEGLRSGRPCAAVFVREGFYGKHPETDALLSTVDAKVLAERDFKRLADTEEPQGVIAAFDWRGLCADEPEGPVVPALYDVADPRNMGTIVRSADWFGVSSIVVGEGCVDPFNGKAARSSMGSVFRLRFVRPPSLADELGRLKDRYRVVVADLDGEDYRSFKGGPDGVYVFSNEARGPSDEILALADAVATIPGAGRAESLSVAVAAAVMIAALS